MFKFDFKKILEKVKNFLKRDHYEKQLEQVLKACEQNPKDLRLKIRLGEIYFKKRDLVHALEAYRQVAAAYTQESFFLKAVAIYKNMIRMAPGTVEFNERLAEIYPQLGMVKDGIAQYLIIVHYYQTHGQREKALEMAQKMVALDPQDIQNRLRLAEIYYNEGHQEEALKEYESIGQQLKDEGGKQLKLLLEVLEKIFFRRPQDLNLLKELCILYLKNHEAELVMKKIERHKLEKEGDFEKIYLKAKEMWEHEQKKQDPLAS